MPVFIIAALALIVAMALLGFAMHLLFSPVVLVILAIFAWLRFRPRKSRQ
jgi:hypothetical protein